MLQHKLLEIAIAEFAAKGLDGASTRGIAAKAGTAMSSITYHYGGKEGLYLASADYIATRIGEELGPGIAIDGVSPDMTPAEARAAIHVIIARLIETMVGANSFATSLFIVREQMEPTEAFGRIYGGLLGRMFERMVELVCIATGRRDAPAAQVAMLTLFGQVIVLRSSRATCLKLLERDDFDAAATTALANRIAANTDAILDRMIAERQELQ